MGLQDEKSDRHRRIGLLKQLVPAGREFLERNEVAERLAHFLAVDRNHVIVHPVTGRVVAASGRALRDLALVMREHQVHASPVYVERLAQVARTHRGALHMPTGESVAPRRRPAHDMLFRGFFPQREIERSPLVALTVERSRVGLHLVEHAARQLAIAVLAVVSLDVEIDRTVAHIGEALLENGLRHLDLLDDMTRSAGFDTRRKHVQGAHRIVVTVGIILRDLHRLELLETGFLGDLVLALVGIVLEVADVGDVAHVAHLIARRFQIAKQQVERNGRTRMSQMRIAVNGGTADVQTDERRLERFEALFAARKRIV